MCESGLGHEFSDATIVEFSKFTHSLMTRRSSRLMNLYNNVD